MSELPGSPADSSSGASGGLTGSDQSSPSSASQPSRLWEPVASTELVTGGLSGSTSADTSPGATSPGSASPGLTSPGATLSCANSPASTLPDSIRPELAAPNVVDRFRALLSMREDNFFLLLAVIIGLFAGLAVVCFRMAIDYTR